MRVRPLDIDENGRMPDYDESVYWPEGPVIVPSKY